MTKVPLNEAVETLAATIRAVGVSSEQAAKAAQVFTSLTPFDKYKFIKVIRKQNKKEGVKKYDRSRHDGNKK